MANKKLKWKEIFFNISNSPNRMLHTQKKSKKSITPKQNHTNHSRSILESFFPNIAIHVILREVL